LNLKGYGLAFLVFWSYDQDIIRDLLKIRDESINQSGRAVLYGAADRRRQGRRFPHFYQTRHPQSGRTG